MAVSPYKIQVSDERIANLKERLSLTTFPDELDASGWDYGTPLDEVKRIVKYWEQEFDWRKIETELNKLPHFHTSIPVDGFGELDIHFVHQKSENRSAIPLLFVHGWPGSFIEVEKLLSDLRGSADTPAFHVVALSLPNFGFSEGVKKEGFAMPQYAEVCNKLMLKLGYSTYAAQGGDWGFFITRTLSLLYPSHLRALHTNFVRSNAPKYSTHPLLALQHAVFPYTDKERVALERNRWFREDGTGYRFEQATKPQTIGYGLADSPAGLLGWIMEKLHDWTDGYEWTDEEVCRWVSIYWFSTAGPAASVRIYYEMMYGPAEYGRDRMSDWIDGVPLGLAHFPKEITPVPKLWGRTLGPVVYESENRKGGHFAAYEVPEAIVHDLNAMFGRDGPCFGAVGGRTGFD